jgi:hypothetical protein
VALAKTDCRASLQKRTTKICLSRALVGKRTAKSLVTVRKLMFAVRPDIKRTENIITHGKRRLSRSDNKQT